MIDLHTHSTASDGDLRPAELVQKASEIGIRVLALTDHDTVSGLAEAKAAATNAGVVLLPGVELEISAEYSGFPEINGEFHLLGLGITKPSGLFFETLKHLEGARERRNRQIIEKMREAGIEASYEDIKAFAGGIVGRPHFGAFLIKRNIVKNQEQAFRRYLGKGEAFYVPKEGLPFQQAAALIHESGGIAVLAHPLSLYLAWGRLPALLGRLKETGLDGVEAWHPTAKIRYCKRLEDLARSLKLFVTAGSDFHGSARPDRKLGYTAGDRKIEDRFLEGMESILEYCGVM